MLKKTISYIDYNGEKQTEDHYFNLSKSELIEMEVSEEGGSLGEKMQRIVDEKNVREIIKMFKEIIKISYGRKSPDGKRFMKSDEIWNDFAQTEAYSELFMELAGNAGAGAEFINGLIPQGLIKDVEKMKAQGGSENLTPEQIRAKSEAQMQGFKKAEPITERKESSVPNLDGMSAEEKAELLRKLQG